MTSATLKLLACALMVVDHLFKKAGIGHVLVSDLSIKKASSYQKGTSFRTPASSRNT